jgi:DNA methylase
MHYYQWTLDYIMDSTDIVLDPFPLMWVKSDKGLLPDPQRGPRRMYETCFFGSLGDRKIVKSVKNVFTCPTDHKDHMSTKPEPMLRHFFEMFVDETTIMLDPTCGSGTALRAAEALKAKHVLGVEIDEEFAKRAELRLWEARQPERSLDEVLGDL